MSLTLLLAPSSFADSPGPMSPAQEGGVVGDEYDRARFLIVLLRYVDTLIWVATSYLVAPDVPGAGVSHGHSFPALSTPGPLFFFC